MTDEGEEQMSPMRRRFVLVAAALLSVTSLTGCGGNATSARPSTSPSPSKPFAVSLQTVASRFIASIEVGGGQPAPVIIDTGSSGLVIDAAHVGPHLSQTGVRLQRRYGFASEGTKDFNTSIIKTTVTLRDRSQALSTGPIAVATFADASRDATMRRIGVYGILGVGPNIVANDAGLMSPLAQLPTPYAAGFTVDPATGVLQLGQPQVAAGSTVVSMSRTSLTFPNGNPSWSKDVNLCWAVSSGHACGPTSVDSGGNYGTVSSTLIPGLLHNGHSLDEGTTVTIDTPDGHQVASTTSNRLHAVNYTSTNHFNTGLLPFIAGAIGYDLLNGRIIFKAG